MEAPLGRRKAADASETCCIGRHLPKQARRGEYHVSLVAAYRRRWSQGGTPHPTTPTVRAPLKQTANRLFAGSGPPLPHPPMHPSPICRCLVFGLCLSGCGDIPTTPKQLTATLASGATENSDVLERAWELPYNRDGLWGDIHSAGGYALDLPAGEYDLEIEVTGGVTVTGIWAPHASHINGVFIGPGGVDAGPYPYYPNATRSIPVSVYGYSRKGHVSPVWTAPPNTDRTATATVRVKGNARYYFTRSIDSSPLNPYHFQWATVTGNQYGRLTARRVRAAELILSCTPNPVVRGEETTCEATTDNPNARLEVEKWWFKGTDSRGQAFEYQQEDVPATTWTGVMALTGKVYVSARVNGAEPVEKSTTVTVTNRDWTAETISYNVREVTYEEFPATGRPPLLPRTPRDLGATWMSGTLLPRTAPGVMRYIQDDGPNSLLAYLGRIPLEAEAIIVVNPAMMPGSDFYRVQREMSPDFTATPPCLQRDFGRFRELILHHEGLPPNPESHSGVFIQELLNRSRVVEDVVGPNDKMPELQDIWEDRLLAATDAALVQADDPVDAAHNVRFGCTFNFSGRRERP